MKNKLNLSGSILALVGIVIAFLIEFFPIYIVLDIAINNSKLDAILSLSYVFALMIVQIVSIVLCAFNIGLSNNFEKYQKKSKLVLATAIFAIISVSYPLMIMVSANDALSIEVFAVLIALVLVGASLIIAGYNNFRKELKKRNSEIAVQNLNANNNDNTY